ncbi:MAG: hypothetical protein AVDCRST_MAG12-2436, partial [uncultured Rubrobacteraceae bacterium]
AEHARFGRDGGRLQGAGRHPRPLRRAQDP